MNHDWSGSRIAPFLLAVACFIVSGCALPGVSKVVIPSAQQNLVPIHVNPEWRLEALGFQAAILDIKRGSAIGAFPGGYSEGSGSFCNFRRSSVMTQAEGRKVIAGRDGDLAAIFYQTLTEIGYKVVGDPTIVFERKEELNKAKYLVAARIVDMKANICNVHSLWDGRPFGTQNGEIYLEIEWSVYSTVQRAVVLTVKSTGYHKSLEERAQRYWHRHRRSPWDHRPKLLYPRRDGTGSAGCLNRVMVGSTEPLRHAVGSQSVSATRGPECA